jgi:hypothetical protein
MSGSLDVPEHLFTAIDHVGIAVADLDAGGVLIELVEPALPA